MWPTTGLNVGQAGPILDYKNGPARLNPDLDNQNQSDQTSFGIQNRSDQIDFTRTIFSVTDLGNDQEKSVSTSYIEYTIYEHIKYQAGDDEMED